MASGEGVGLARGAQVEVLLGRGQAGFAILAGLVIGLGQQPPGDRVVLLVAQGALELVDAFLGLVRIVEAGQGLRQVDPQQGGVRLELDRPALRRLLSTF